MAVHPLDAVGGPQAFEAVPLEDAGESSALARADHIDAADLGEDLDRQGLPFGHPAGVGVFLADFTDKSFRLGAHLLGVAALRLAGALSLLVGEPELQGGVAVALRGPHLEHRARAALQHGHGNGGAVRQVNLGHADFAAEQSDSHRENSVVSIRPRR